MNETVHEFHLTEKFLIILTGSVQINTNTVNEAFETLWKNGLINSHVLSQDEMKSWTLQTFLPYHDSCIALSHLKIDSFTRLNFSNSMNLSIDQVYPKKLKNNNRCRLYIAPTESILSVLSTTSDGKPQSSGIDITIADEISKLLNFTAVALMKTEHGIVVKRRAFMESFNLV